MPSARCARESGHLMNTIFFSAAILGGVVLMASFILTLLQDR
jgi:hypothetical protein